MSNFNNKTQNFTICDNHILTRSLRRESPVSLKALGLFIFMSSKPPTWNFSEAGLASQLQDGLKSIKTSISELLELGYLSRFQERDKLTGFLGKNVYTVHSEPLFPFPSTDNPSTDKDILVNTKEVNTKEVNTNSVLSEEKKKFVSDAILHFKPENPKSYEALLYRSLMVKTHPRHYFTNDMFDRYMKIGFEVFTSYAPAAKDTFSLPVGKNIFDMIEEEF